MGRRQSLDIAANIQGVLDGPTGTGEVSEQLAAHFYGHQGNLWQ